MRKLTIVVKPFKVDAVMRALLAAGLPEQALEALARSTRLTPSQVTELLLDQPAPSADAGARDATR